MKILQIGCYGPPYGGEQIHLQFLRQLFLNTCNECIVLNMGSNKKIKSKNQANVQNPFDYFLKLIKYYSQGYHPYIALAFIGNSVKVILTPFLAVLIASLFRKKVFYYFFGGPNQHYFNKKLNFFEKAIIKFNFCRAEKIFCNHVIVKEKIVAAGGIAEKIFAIPCFSKKQYLNAVPSKVPKKLKKFLKLHKPIFSSIIAFRRHGFNPLYELEMLCEVMPAMIKKHPQIGLVIVGAGSASKQAKKMIQAVNLDENVFFMGDVSHAAALAILRKSNVFLRLPETDGISASVREALSLGIPTIASENALHPKNTILFKKGNAKDLIKKIEAVLKNYEKIKKTTTLDEENKDNLEKIYCLIKETIEK